ncbi:MAG: fibronectin type III domain-containing protein [Flavobacteriales bacterium]|nr:fibronectin type III domain-containing protein [Flavobacteriales bacterium]
MKKVVYIIKLGYDRVTARLLVEKGRNSSKMMANNPAFLAPNPLPNPTLAQVDAACDKLEAANDAYGFNRGKVEKGARDQAFEDLKLIYRNLGSYVQIASDGDKEIILSAGFDTMKLPQPVGELPAVGDVRATATKYHGTIEVRWNGVKNRRLYKLYISSGDPSLETGWELLAETGKNRFVAEGLERFKTYSFRVEAIGPLGASPMSDHASATAA